MRASGSIAIQPSHPIWMVSPDFAIPFVSCFARFCFYFYYYIGWLVKTLYTILRMYCILTMARICCINRQINISIAKIGDIANNLNIMVCSLPKKIINPQRACAATVISHGPFLTHPVKPG